MKKRSKRNIREITTNELAVMVQGGFKDTAKRVEDLKIDVEDVKTDVEKLRKDMNYRFDIVENKIIARHEREIEQLRDKVLKIEVSIAKLQNM